jgi:hypothetical protein
VLGCKARRRSIAWLKKSTRGELALLFIAVDADMADDTLLDSLLLKPIAATLFAVPEEPPVDVALLKLVFFASRSIIVIKRLKAGSSSSSIVLEPGDPDSFVMDVPAKRLMRLKPLFIIASVSEVVKSPVEPDIIE